MSSRPPHAERRYILLKKNYVANYKAANGCAHCGESDPVVLDLHHPEREEKSPRLKRNRTYAGTQLARLPWGELEQELEKGKILCANCHRREEHRIRMGA